MIETMMGCNLHCDMCPVPDSRAKMNGRKAVAMSLTTFEKILEEISDRPRCLHLNQMGEPLLNKNLSLFIRLAKKRGHYVSLTSNGALLTRELSTSLINSGIDKIIFSVDGCEADTYESIRKGAVYEKTRSNIELFCELKNSSRHYVDVQIDCILSDLTRDQIPAMQKFWLGKIDHFNVIPLNDWGGNFELPERFGTSTYAGYIEEKRYPCSLLWDTLAISAEGNLMYCCHDYCLLSRLPNVNDVPLRKIWRDFVSQERKKHVLGKIDCQPCLGCDAWKSRPVRFPPQSFSEKLRESFPFKLKSRLKYLGRRLKSCLQNLFVSS